MSQTTQDKILALELKFPELFASSIEVSIPRGWLSLVEKLCEDLEKLAKAPKNNQRVTIAQIKSKYGGLRFYVDNGTEKMYKLISAAEAKSRKMCELCGAAASLRTDLGIWVWTFCDAHHEAAKQAKQTSHAAWSNFLNENG